MLSLLGSVLGFGTSIVPKIFDMIQDGKDKKHELALMAAQIDQQRALGEIKLQHLHVEADIKETESLMKHSSKLQSKASPWVRDLAASVRPCLTYLLALEFGVLTLCVNMDWMTMEQYKMIWNDEFQAVWAAVVSFLVRFAHDGAEDPDMKISSRGLEIIQHFEGWSASVYKCSAGYITQGWGSCFDDRGLPISPDADDIDKVRGAAYLRYACRHVEGAIKRLVLTRAPLTQGMFDASCSLAYNIGTGAFARSTIRQRLARGDYEGAADIWWQFRRGGGRILPGLVRRRAAEKELFLSDG